MSRTRPALLLLLAACGGSEGVLLEPAEPAPPLPERAIAAGVCDYDPSESTLTGPGWTRVFDEGFSAGLTQWTTWTGGAFNEELQLYQGANLSVASGTLSIAARKETRTGPTTLFDATPKSFTWTSGRIESKPSFSASNATPRVRISARLKLAAGYGMWPAFWSYGDPWPTQGEIDIMEAKGQEPFQYNTAYWYGRRSGQNLVANSARVIPSTTSLTDCWHVYEVIWAKNSLTYLLDGQVVDTKSGGYIPSMFRKSQRVTLNLAVGGLFFGTYDPAAIVPGTLQVDWVKVFTAK